MTLLKDIFRKTALSALAILGFVGIAYLSPSWSEEAKTPLSSIALRTPEGLGLETGKSSPLIVNGLPFGLETKVISDCSARPADPFAIVGCKGQCFIVSRQVDGASPATVWTELQSGQDPARPSLHAAILQCRPDGLGELTHLWLASGLGSSNLGRVLEGEGQARPIPLLAGARQVACLQASGWSIIIDRPRFPDLALEQMQFALSGLGWQPAKTAELDLEPDAPESRVFLHGSQICIVAMRTDAEEQLLISACKLSKTEAK